ncbi:hypothetical protein EZV62_027693 [Acer yangbiense]|uniref:Uncharacterized protein n=1 Tax=Acer yangbiense TaxID=1000413 RepID=A0A5C7GV61_9ROSI|nr:hypothetical protein EZV62_027693 [Acer yangbiense]
MSGCGFTNSQPSTVEVMTALIWRAQINATRARYGHLKTSMMSMPMNLRGRTFEKIPKNCCGNFFTMINAKIPVNDSKMGLNDFVDLVRDAIRNSITEFAQPSEGEDGFFSKVMKPFREFFEELGKKDGDLIFSGEKPAEEIEDDKGNKSPNQLYQSWINNDGLLSSWLLGTMKEEVMSLIYSEVDTAYKIWTSIEEQLLPVIVEKEGLLKNMLMSIRKGLKSHDEYLKKFKSICDNLAAIKKLVSDGDKVFQFAHGLGKKYMDFRTAMLTKPPYPSFSQFVLALQGHEQAVLAHKEEEKTYLEHAQAYFGQRGCGRNGRGGRGNFNSRGRGFTSAGRHNS